MKYLNRIRTFFDFLDKRSICKGYPFEYVLAPTTICNLRCPMCARELSKKPNNDILSFEKFKIIVSKIEKYAELISFAGLGEPLFNNDIYRMINYVKNKNIGTLLSTNATVLDEEKANSLLESKLDIIVFSMDGALKETYEKNRLGANFERTKENILNFLKIKEKYIKIKKTFVIMQMLYLKGCENEIPLFKKMWNIRGVNRIRIKEDEIQKNKNVTSDKYNECDKNKCTSKNVVCPFLWRGTPYIKVNGDFLPCCWAHEIDNLGNIYSEDIEGLWNSEKMVAIRKMHLTKHRDEVKFCSNCNALQPKKIAILSSIIFGSLFQKKQISTVETADKIFKILR